MYTKSTKSIYETWDYDMFKTLDGNRDVNNGRVLKTIESIEKYGWLTNPILVNEKFEVIDGQGRLEALRRLNLPVEFIIEPGIGRKECQGLNHFQKNWSLDDYVNSFVTDGNENYIWLRKMLKKYKKLPKAVIYSIAVYKCDSAATRYYNEKLENGLFEISETEKKIVDDALFYLDRFADTVKYIGGRADRFYSAILFLYKLDSIDNDRLCRVINNSRYDGLISSGTTEGYIQQFEILYNRNLTKAKRIDMTHEYKIA